jgi:hypothetical protein
MALYPLYGTLSPMQPSVTSTAPPVSSTAHVPSARHDISHCLAKMMMLSSCFAEIGHFANSETSETTNLGSLNSETRFALRFPEHFAKLFPQIEKITVLDTKANIRIILGSFPNPKIPDELSTLKIFAP